MRSYKITDNITKMDKIWKEACGQKLHAKAVKSNTEEIQLRLHGHVKMLEKRACEARVAKRR